MNRLKDDGFVLAVIVVVTIHRLAWSVGELIARRWL